MPIGGEGARYDLGAGFEVGLDILVKGIESTGGKFFVSSDLLNPSLEGQLTFSTPQIYLLADVRPPGT